MRLLTRSLAQGNPQKVTKMAKKFFSLKIHTWGFSGTLNPNLLSKSRNSKWRRQYGGRKCEIFLDFNKNWYFRIFVVADYEFNLKIVKYKMATTKWRTKI